MSNKLKDLFSNETFNYGETLYFDNAQSYQEFQDALQQVWDEGKTIPVGGIKAIKEELTASSIHVPLVKHENIQKCVVAPAIESISVNVETELGDRNLIFCCIKTKNETIFETSKESIVYIELRFNSDKSKLKLSYKNQIKNARNTNEIIENYSIIEAFLEKVFPPQLEATSSDSKKIANCKTLFKETKEYFQRVDALEKVLNVSFEPVKLNDDNIDQEEIEELYWLLVGKKALRSKLDLSKAETTVMQPVTQTEKPAIGDLMSLMYCSEDIYKVYGKEITIYTFNVLVNSVLKEIEEQDNGLNKFILSDTDSQPMFTSYSGYLTEEEAAEELNNIKSNIESNIDRYINAKKLNYYRLTGREES